MVCGAFELFLGFFGDNLPLLPPCVAKTGPTLGKTGPTWERTSGESYVPTEEEGAAGGAGIPSEHAVMPSANTMMKGLRAPTMTSMKLANKASNRAC